MNLKELIYRNRTIRRFDQSVRISHQELEDLVDLARVTSNAGNNQALKYVLVTDPAVCQVVFDTLKWAAALPDWDGPEEGERPSAYIIAIHDESISKNILWDLGLAIQSITLGAVDKGYGGCQFGSVNFPALKAGLGITDEAHKPLMVLALGKPIEQVELTDLPANAQTTYWRDDDQVHYVPKRQLSDIILKRF